MNVWSHGDDKITFDDDNNTYKFIMDDHVKLEISDDFLKLRDVGGHEIFTVNRIGGMHLMNDLCELNKPGTSDYILRVGRGVPGDVRGRIEIRQQPLQGLPGDEFYLPKKAGVLVLYDENGNDYFLWVDTNGKLRISGSDPGSNDVSGTVVGAQT